MKRTRFGGKVRADAKSGRDQYRQAGAFLERNAPFDHNVRLPEQKRGVAIALYNKLFSATVKIENQWTVNTEVLLANLIINSRRAVSVSLNPNTYCHPYQRTTALMIKIIKAMNEEGYIELKKGYKGEKTSRMSRIYATDKFLRFCPLYPDTVIYDPVTLVVLRDEHGREIPFKHTAKTLRVNTVLTRANRVNAAADIMYQRERITAYLLAVYKCSFDLYGRLHTRGFRHLQGYKEGERAEITINGEAVVELDFAALHPNLLYAAEGLQYAGDPYAAVDPRPEARAFLKRCLLAMLNAKDQTQALRATNYVFYQDPAEKQRLNAIGITTAKPFIEKFKQAHPPIAHYFCAGKETGLRVMNRDARIALDVVDHFARQGKVVLAVHDSFIVQRKYRDELERVMHEKYMKHTGGFTIRVK